MQRSAGFYLLEDWRTTFITEKFTNIWVDYEMDYPLALMQANVHMQSFMKRYFPRGNPFYELAGELLKLQPALEETIMKARQTMFAPHTIGLQIRRYKGHNNFLPAVENYARLALAIQQEKGWADNETAFFLASDNPSVYGDLETVLKGRSVLQMEKKMTMGMQQSANPGSIRDAIADIRLLSMCDEIVTTYGSSFGSMAAAWGGVEPYVMLHGATFELNDQLTHVSTCSSLSVCPTVESPTHHLQIRCRACGWTVVHPWGTMGPFQCWRQ